MNGDISGALITFEIDGKQYLAVGAGERIAQTQFYAWLTDTRLAPGSGVIWVFALPKENGPLCPPSSGTPTVHGIE